MLMITQSAKYFGFLSLWIKTSPFFALKQLQFPPHWREEVGFFWIWNCLKAGPTVVLLQTQRKPVCFLTAVERSSKDLDVTGGSWYPVDSHLIHASPLHFPHTAPHHMRNQHSVLSGRGLTICVSRLFCFISYSLHLSDVLLHFTAMQTFSLSVSRDIRDTRPTQMWGGVSAAIFHYNGRQRTYCATVSMETQKTGGCWAVELGGSSGWGEYFRDSVTSTSPNCSVCLLHRSLRALDSSWQTQM